MCLLTVPTCAPLHMQASPRMDDVQTALIKVESEIKAVNAKLEEVEAEIKQARAERNTEEVAMLRTKEEHLRTKEEQLRAEKLLLLQRQSSGARCCVWRRWFADQLIARAVSELRRATTACGCSGEQHAGGNRGAACCRSRTVGEPSGAGGPRYH